MDQIIKIENLNLWYNRGKPTESHALRNINLEIRKGDYVTFFGPSGCGKTTILYSISGIDKFQEGNIVVDGNNIANLSSLELAVFRQKGIGIIFQQFNLIPSLSVIKNVALPMLFVGTSSKEAEKRALELLKRLDIGAYAESYPYELSGGQQQRVGIARALANNPPIIIADEPLGNLDSVNAKVVLKFLKELNEKDGRTVIMVTHEAWSLCDTKTVFHMKDGSVTDVETIDKRNVAESITKRITKQLSSMSVANHLELEQINYKKNEENLLVRTLANFLLKGSSMDEVSRFENFIERRLDGDLDSVLFFKYMRKSWKEGGMGLRLKRALHNGEFLEEIVKQRKNVDLVFRAFELNPALQMTPEIVYIREWLTFDYKGRIKDEQVLVLNQIISDRIREYITKDQVLRLLKLSKKRYGAGFSFRTSENITEKLEIILSNHKGEFQEK